MDSVKKNLLELYVYTTPTWQEQKLLKIGHCKKGTHKKRIRGQFNASNPERPSILWVKDLPEGKTDHNIHSQLLKNGVTKKEDGVGKEWFYASLDDIKKAFNQVTKDSRTYDYQLRDEQKQAVKKAEKWFLNSNKENKYNNRFLLKAKMRFGKCFTGISIAKKLKAKKTIVVTFKTNVKDSWMKYPNQHKNFTNWKGITSKKDDVYDSLENGFDINSCKKNLVLFVSMQDLRGGANKSKFKNLFKTHWDVLIFDEIHYGGDAKIEKEIFDIEKITKEVEEKIKELRLKYTYRVDMSGTPFRFETRHNFHEDQIFTYTYLDEQKKKVEEKINREKKTKQIYERFPKLNLWTTEITQEEVNRQRLRDQTHDEDWSLNKLFKVTDEQKGFDNDEAVNHFLENLIKTGHENTRNSVYGDVGRIKCKFPVDNKRHSLWWVYSTNTAKALEDTLKKHHYFKKYKIINVAGDNKKIAECDFNNMLSGVQNNPNELGSITITHSRLLTGVTVEKLDSILVLNDCKSPETYLQAIFRVQSPWLDGRNSPIKKECYVFDFAIKRCLKIIYELGKKIAEKDKVPVDQIYHELIEAMNISQLKFLDGELTSEKIEVEDIIENYDERTLAKKLNSRRNLVSANWFSRLANNLELEAIVSKIRGYRAINTEEKDSGLKLSKKDKTRSNKPHTSSVNNKLTLEDRKKRKYIGDQGVRLSVILADFMYMTKKREGLVKDIIENRLKEKTFFKSITGITVEEFELLCNPDKGLFKKDELNNRIGHFYRKENSSIKTNQFLLDSINRQFENIQEMRRKTTAKKRKTGS